MRYLTTTRPGSRDKPSPPHPPPQASDSTPDSAAPFPFFKLPLEVRFLVYDILFPRDAPDYVIPRAGNPPSARLAPLLTCRALHAECRDLAFRRTPFHLSGYLYKLDIYPGYNPGSAAQERGALRHVTRVSMSNSVLDGAFYGESFLGIGWPRPEGRLLVDALPALRVLVLRHNARDYPSLVGTAVVLFAELRVVVAVGERVPFGGPSGWTEWGKLTREMSDQGLGVVEGAERHLDWVEEGDDKWERCLTVCAGVKAGGDGEWRHVHLYFCAEEEGQKRAVRRWRNRCPWHEP